MGQIRTEYIIYGSGDAGTLELRGIFTERNIPYTFVDIRRAARKGRTDPMQLLGKHHLLTVPQVFTLDGQYIGNFDVTMAYLDGREDGGKGCRVTRDERIRQGIAYAQNGYLSVALLWFQDALAKYPGDPWIEHNIGRVMVDSGRYDDALGYARSAAEKLDTPGAWGNYGVCLYRTNQFHAAAQVYERIVQATPDDADMQYNLAFTWLALQQYDAGFRQLAWRKRRAGWAEREAVVGLPYWDGQTLGDDQTVLVFHEQGFGDGLMLARYIPLVQQRVRDVQLICPPPLERLFQQSFDVPVHGHPALAPAASFQTSLFDLPAIFGINTNNIPKQPYLKADSTWAAPVSDQFRVGLVWAGASRPNSVARLTDSRRSLRLDQLEPVLAVPGVQFVSLQKGQPALQAMAYPQIENRTDEIDSFADTANLISTLDLVISVDTSVVHLAAGMGKPVWLMNRYDSCWRWLDNANTWYDSIEEFRQRQPGEWEPVIMQIAERLTMSAVNTEMPPKARRLIASALRDRITVLQLELAEELAEDVRCEREDDLSYAKLLLAMFEA